MNFTVGGGPYTFAKLADVDASSLYVQASGSLTLPALASYTNANGYDSTYFQATGSNSVLSLPGLASLGQLQSYLYFQATQGGQVNAPALDSVADPSQQNEYLEINADGAGSQVDLSKLASLGVTTGYLNVTNQATVLDPKLAALSGMNVTLDGTGTLATDQWASLDDGSVTIKGGSYSLKNLANVDGSSLYVQASTSLALPALASYTNPNGYDSTYFQATGSKAVLSLPKLTALGLLQSYLYFQATQGGQVNAPALDSIADPSTQNEYLQVDVDGAGSQIDLSALATIDVTTGYVTITNGGTLVDPGLATIHGVNFTVGGGPYTFAKLADIDSSSIYVQDSGSLALPAVTSYSNPNSYDDTYLEATGTNAVLNLPALTGLGFLQSYLHFQATQGGQVNAPALDSIADPSTQNEYLQVDVDGAGSQIDLSALATIDVTTGYVTITNGGTLVDPGLATIHGVNFTVGGGPYTFAKLADIDSSSIYVQDSGSLALPAVTSYSNPNSYDDTYLEATGTNAVLNLPALTSLGFLQSYLHFQATQGGQVNAPALDSIADPSTQNEYLQVDVDGAGSQIDLSALATIDVTTGYVTITNGGTLVDPGLATIHGVNLRVGGGTYTFPKLVDIDSSSLYADASATLTLPALASYMNPNSYDDTYLEATGTDAVLDLPALASLGYLQSYLHFQATQGGQVNAPALESVANPSQQNEFLQAYADGSSSLVSLPALTAIDVTTGYFTASDSGQIALTTGTVAVTGVNVSVTSSGTITAGTLQLLPGSSLSGNSTVTANVNTAGTTSPGNGNTGILTIDGNFAQYGDGSLDIQIGGTTAGTQFDQLAVTGAATLGGALDVGLINGFTPQKGNQFPIITYGSQSGQFTRIQRPDLRQWGRVPDGLRGERALAGGRPGRDPGLAGDRAGHQQGGRPDGIHGRAGHPALGHRDPESQLEQHVGGDRLALQPDLHDLRLERAPDGRRHGRQRQPVGERPLPGRLRPGGEHRRQLRRADGRPGLAHQPARRSGEPPGRQPRRIPLHRAEPGVEPDDHLGRQERRQHPGHGGLGRPGGHQEHDDRRYAGDRRRPHGPERGRPARPGGVDRPAVRLHPADRGRRHGQHPGHRHRQRGSQRLRDGDQPGQCEPPDLCQRRRLSRRADHADGGRGRLRPGAGRDVDEQPGHPPDHRQRDVVRHPGRHRRGDHALHADQLDLRGRGRHGRDRRGQGDGRARRHLQPRRRHQHPRLQQRWLRGHRRGRHPLGDVRQRPGPPRHADVHPAGGVRHGDDHGHHPHERGGHSAGQPVPGGGHRRDEVRPVADRPARRRRGARLDQQRDQDGRLGRLGAGPGIGRAGPRQRLRDPGGRPDQRHHAQLRRDHQRGRLDRAGRRRQRGPHPARDRRRHLLAGADPGAGQWPAHHHGDLHADRRRPRSRPP